MRTRDAAVVEIMSGVQTGLAMAVQAALAPSQDGRTYHQWANYWAKLAGEAQCALNVARGENLRLRNELADSQRRLANAQRILSARGSR